MAGLTLDPWQQAIMVDALGESDGKWSAFEVAVMVGRQNGKGALLEARELAGLYLFGEQLILHSAHEFKTATEAFRRIRALVDNTDDLRRQVKKITVGHGDEGIELITGQRLRFVARSTGSGRGFSGDCVILDEAYALTQNHLEALLPTLSARPNPQIWYTSSPPLDPISGAVLFGVRERGLEGGDGLAYFDFGAEGDLGDLSKLDLDDRKLWAATNPAYGIRINEEFIARERSAMSAEGFARERLGVWPSRVADGPGVLDLAAWKRLADAESRRTGDVAFAIDVTPARDAACIAVYGLRADGLGHLEVIDHRPGTDWLVDRLVELKSRHNPVAIGLDSKGPAGSLLVDLEKADIVRPANADEPARGDLAIPTAQDVAAACGQLADAVTQATVRHIGQDLIEAAIRGVKTRPLGDAWAWGRRVSTVDISPLVAATLARWAYESRAHLIEDDYDVLDSVL